MLIRRGCRYVFVSELEMAVKETLANWVFGPLRTNWANEVRHVLGGVFNVDLHAYRIKLGYRVRTARYRGIVLRHGNELNTRERTRAPRRCRSTPSRWCCLLFWGDRRGSWSGLAAQDQYRPSATSSHCSVKARALRPDPIMPERRLRPLMDCFRVMLAGEPLFADVFWGFKYEARSEPTYTPVRADLSRCRSPCGQRMYWCRSIIDERLELPECVCFGNQHREYCSSLS